MSAVASGALPLVHTRAVQAQRAALRAHAACPSPLPAAPVPLPADTYYVKAPYIVTDPAVTPRQIGEIKEFTIVP